MASSKARILDKDTIALSVSDARVLKAIFEKSEAKWKTLEEALVSERQASEGLLKAKDDYIKTLEALKGPRRESPINLILYVDASRGFNGVSEQRFGARVEWRIQFH